MDNKYVFMVQVSCMTFNHSPYIVDTMNGFCMQQTSFPFVCTIFDDFSTDGEQEEIKQYVKENFDLDDAIVSRNEETDDFVFCFARHKKNLNCFFAVYYLKYNHYSIGKDYRKYEYCKAFCEQVKYVALCEGDDYWTDPLKLQKQVDYMENHPECGMVYTQVDLYNQEQGIYRKGWAAQTDFEDLLLNSNKIITLATCFRRDLFEKYRAEIIADKNWKMGDFPLWLYISHHSSLKYFDETTGVYRLLPTSASHNPDIKKMMGFLVSTYEVRCFFAKKYGREDLLDTFAANEVNNLFRLSVQKDKNISGFIFRFAKIHGVVSISTLVKCLLYSTRVGRSFHRKKYPSEW